jgi:hypothetical protein
MLNMKEFMILKATLLTANCQKNKTSLLKRGVCFMLTNSTQPGSHGTKAEKLLKLTD